MKAVVLSATYDPKVAGALDHRGVGGHLMWRYPRLSIEDMPEPSIISDDDVILRVVQCGLCGSDLHASEADADGYMKFSGPARPPVAVGHELVGVVVARGRSVIRLTEGQMVSPESIQACGGCNSCKHGHLNQCASIELIGLTVNGALAQFVRVKEKHCYPITPILDRFGPEKGVTYGTLLEPLGCAYNGLFIDRLGKNQQGVGKADRVVVFGSGPIGLGAVALCRTAGASRVIAFDTIDERAALALKVGADKAYNITRLANEGIDVVEVIKDVTGGLGATIVVEAAGCANLFSVALDALSERGRFVYLGRTPQRVEFDPNILVSKALTISGSRGHAGYGIFPRLIALTASGQLDLTNFVTANFDFENALTAFVRAREQRDGKILIRVSEEQK